MIIFLSIINTITALCAIWLSYISSQEAISRWKGIKEIEATLKYEQDYFGLVFLMQNKGIKAQKIQSVKNEKGELVLYFSNNLKRFVQYFDTALKATIITPIGSNLNETKSHRSNDANKKPLHLSVTTPLVLSPGEIIHFSICIFFYNDNSNRLADRYVENDSDKDILRKLENSNELFIINDLGKREKIVSKADIKKALDGYNNAKKKLDNERHQYCDQISQTDNKNKS